MGAALTGRRSVNMAGLRSTALVLSDVDIKKHIASGKIRFVPTLQADQFGSCSVDLRLGNEFNVFEYQRFPFVDLRNPVGYQDLMRKVIVADGEPFVLQPSDFVLAITQEEMSLSDDILGRLEGRSSLGRLGIIVHGTAGLFDPGWIGKATLELSNLSRLPVALYPGMRICSFTFEQLSSPSSNPYRTKPGNKYAGQQSPMGSQLCAEVSKLR